MKRGKRYSESLKKVDRSVQYDALEAVRIVKEAASAKFDETVELHIRTGCDGRHAEQQVRGAVVLPNGTGKTVRVLVFAKNDKADKAKAAGADFVGAEELIPKIQNEGWLDFDVVVAISSIMRDGRMRIWDRQSWPQTATGRPRSCTPARPKVRTRRSVICS